MCVIQQPGVLSSYRLCKAKGIQSKKFTCLLKMGWKLSYNYLGVTAGVVGEGNYLEPHSGSAPGLININYLSLEIVCSLYLFFTLIPGPAKKKMKL